GQKAAHFSSRSQSFTVLSQLPAASTFFFGENARQSTSPVCCSFPFSFHVFVSQRRISPGRFQSPSPLASVLPSCENATAQTSPACPLSVATSSSSGPHTFTIPYRVPATRKDASGWNAIDR